MFGARLPLLLARRRGIGSLIVIFIEHPIPSLLVGATVTAAWFGGNHAIESKVKSLAEDEANRRREELRKLLGVGIAVIAGGAIFYAASQTLW